MDRKKLEQEVVRASENVEADQLKTDWIDSPQYQEFVDRFYQLVKYYELRGNDDQISLNVVFQYVDFMKMFRGMLLYMELSDTLRKHIIDEMEGLEYLMIEMFRFSFQDD